MSNGRYLMNGTDLERKAPVIHFDVGFWSCFGASFNTTNTNDIYIYMYT